MRKSKGGIEGDMEEKGAEEKENEYETGKGVFAGGDGSEIFPA